MEGGSVMSFVDKFSDVVSESMKVISNKSSSMVEISKMNLSIRKREKEIESLLLKIGELVYRQTKLKQSINSGEIDDLVNRIDYLHNEVETLEKLVFKMQDIRACDYCKEVFEKKVSYCPLCGKHIKNY